jgi:thiamine-phosphate pyrophosphorylase
MPQHFQPPIIYLITSGATKPDSNQASEDFQNILALVRASVKARVSLIQLREKNLPARTLYELTARCAAITEGTATRLLVNDRADIARAARADGVHLTAHSIEASIIRRTFGTDFLVGVSTHSLAEAQAARDASADFAVFGPIFDTPSKRAYGPPVGLEALREAAHTLSQFPIIALGGITQKNATDALRAGASGIAAIRLFTDPDNIDATVRVVRRL